MDVRLPPCRGSLADLAGVGTLSGSAGGLFGPDLPAGFHHRPDFITHDEERALISAIATVAFSTFEMRGVAARRRVAFFGASYDAGASPSPPIPDYLFPVRSRLAAWAGVAAERFAMALINEYPRGAPIGWHRDAPQYDIVAGVSLLTGCRMKFRPYRPPGRSAGVAPSRRMSTHEIVLEPRSAYLITGDARSEYEHHIPAVASLRYSITFRTLR